MRLLHIIASMNPKGGGPCQGIRNSAAELLRMGVEREVVSMDDPAEPFINEDIITINALGEGTGPWGYNAKLLPWLIENLPRFNVVVINGLWLYPSYAGWKAMKYLKKQSKKNKDIKLPQYFVMPHGMLDPYFQVTRERKLKAVRNWFYWKLFEATTVNDADGLLFTCEAELELARKTFKPYHPKREINVGYGIISPPPFTDDMRSAFIEKCAGLIDNNDSYLLFLSRIHPKKGVDLLLQSYLSLYDETSRKGIKMPKLVIAGPGIETDFGKRIKKLVTCSPYSSSVLFTGMLSGDAKWGAFYGCEAFVLPSHQENFGIAVAEALACAKPVLISDQVNIWREIDAEGGALVAADTLTGTRTLLEQWLNMDPDSKKVMGKNALQAFLKNFGIHSAAKHFYEALKN